MKSVCNDPSTKSSAEGFFNIWRGNSADNSGLNIDIVNTIKFHSSIRLPNLDKVSTLLLKIS